MRKRSTAAFFALALAVVIASCREPTKITLTLTTDVDCAVVASTGAEVAAAASPSTAETTTPTVHTTRCDHGTIGTLVVTPLTRPDALVAMRVVLGVNAPAASCTTANQYQGCIVQRRVLAYIPHEDLELPIALERDCLDIPCSEDETCAHGTCVRSYLPCEPGASCTLGPSAGDGGGVVDGSTDGPSDGSSDATPTDGASDGSDGSADASDGGVGCDPVTCPTQALYLCCWDAVTQIGVCKKRGSLCPALDLACTGRASCTGPGQYCCASTAASACASACASPDEWVCHDDNDCPLLITPHCDHATPSTLSPTGGYFGHCIP